MKQGLIHPMDDTVAFNEFAANTADDLFADDDDDLFLNEEEYEKAQPSKNILNFIKFFFTLL